MQAKLCRMQIKKNYAYCLLLMCNYYFKANKKKETYLHETFKASTNSNEIPMMIK